jgi:type VI secretion system protein ImpK
MTHPAPAASQGAVPVSRGYLALALQEALTAIVRLRADRQVAADSESFRGHAKQVLGMAEQEARRAGYSSDEVRLALYAVIAFLDESVLNSRQPMFADWPRKPLQDELFGGGHVGGEVFFRNLDRLLQQQDSPQLADVLEVYQLCLLLGFHGRYSAQESGELQMLMSRVAEKMQRIRGPHGELSPEWAPPAGDIAMSGRDPWARPLGIAAAFAVALLVVLFVTYGALLRSGASDVRAASGQVAG